jgi:hypothetical protein
MNANLESFHSDAWRSIGVVDTALKIVALFGVVATLASLTAMVADFFVSQLSFGSVPLLTVVGALLVVFASTAALVPLQAMAKRSFITRATNAGFGTQEAELYWDNFDWDDAKGSVG